jgi:hypothetical protein
MPEPLNPSASDSGLQPAAQVQSTWDVNEIAGWIIKSLLALALFFVGAEYSAIKTRTASLEAKVIALELHLAEAKGRNLASTVDRLEDKVDRIEQHLLSLIRPGNSPWAPGPAEGPK